MESVLDQHLMIGYSSTEIAGGMIVADEHVLRPPVIDYKLVDVPELGYFNTDKPYPRGELVVKSARFMAGYYKRPDLTATDVRRRRLLQDRRHHGRGRTGPAALRRPAQQRHQALAGRVRRRLATGGAVRQEPVRPADLHLRQQRASLPAGRRRADRRRRGAGPRRDRATSLRAGRRASNQLNGYEIPRDFLLETEPFSLENGLLSGVGKFLRPKLKDRYGPRWSSSTPRWPTTRSASCARCAPVAPISRCSRPSCARCRPPLAYRPADIDPRGPVRRPRRRFAVGADLFAAARGHLRRRGTGRCDHRSRPATCCAVAELHRAASRIRMCSSRPSPRCTARTAHEVRAGDLTLDKFIDADAPGDAASLPRPDQ